MNRTVIDRIEAGDFIWDVIPAAQLPEDAELLADFDSYRFFSTQDGPVAVWLGLPSDALLGICG